MKLKIILTLILLSLIITRVIEGPFVELRSIDFNSDSVKLAFSDGSDKTLSSKGLKSEEELRALILIPQEKTQTLQIDIYSTEEYNKKGKCFIKNPKYTISKQFSPEELKISHPSVFGEQVEEDSDALSEQVINAFKLEVEEIKKLYSGQWGVSMNGNPFSYEIKPKYTSFDICQSRKRNFLLK
jgi:hypothetical protein